jgi:serine/threonine-protein kinase
VLQLCEAVGEAHAQGIVHRDLKPENIIITKSASDPDVVKLLDFGIARMVNESNTKHLTRDGEVFGTPHYMAPEQARGDKNMGPPVDVYATGIMLFELLTGNCPFDADTPLSVLMMHVSEPLPELTPRPGVQVSAELEAFVRRACSKEVEDRFANATEMLAHLDELIAQMGGFNLSSTGTHLPLRPSTARSQELHTEVSPSSFSVAVQDPSPEDTFPPTGTSLANNKPILIGAAVIGTLVLLILIGVAVSGSKDKTSASPADAQAATKPVAVTEIDKPAAKPAEPETDPLPPPDERPEDTAHIASPPPENLPDKPVDQPVDKPTDKPVVRKNPTTNTKPINKPAEKPAEKPADKPADKPVEKPADKQPARLDKQPVRLDQQEPTKQPARLDKQPVRLDQQ